AHPARPHPATSRPARSCPAPSRPGSRQSARLRPRPGRRRPAAPRPGGPGARRRPGRAQPRRADGGLDGRRGAAPHADHGPLDVLVAQPCRVLGEGRVQRSPAVGAGGPAGLRRRHPARHRRPGGPRLPHRRHHLLRRPGAARHRGRAAGRHGPAGGRRCGDGGRRV
ncbi:MAG: Phosphoribosyl-AMP cyclohydrolase, partial [uncultured Friedmanniella sp.]